jgi:hypothetical protein
MKKVTIIILVFLFFTGLNVSYAQDHFISGPAGSGYFGSVTVLPNGNFVVIDHLYDEGGLQDVGAVYLYNGTTKALISTLKGSTTNDKVGSGRATVLSNGNFVVISHNWNNGAATNAGAVTWINATAGLSGVVSSANSIVGSATDDGVGGAVVLLNNGNYVVRSFNWNNGAAANAGAVTWCNGSTGTTGVVSAANSLVGSSTNDRVGSRLVALSNGNYVVNTWEWNNGAVTRAGAVTWCNGTSGRVGVVSSSNSLVGTQVEDQVGQSIVTLDNGNYVVRSPNWANGAVLNAGAVSWCLGTSGRSGTINSGNSFVGTRTNDAVGKSVIKLSNNVYVICSYDWNSATATKVGAVTFCNGLIGRVGTINSLNSLVGSQANDEVGWGGVKELTNGNYVISSYNWSNGALARVGAVTWASSTSWITGTISASNSLIGTSAQDRVGLNIEVLTNGNYVVGSSQWRNGGLANAGAATWCNGTTGRTGTVSASNSLVGSNANDYVGSSINALANGNYVVGTSSWANGAATRAGAVTWGNGTSGIVGPVTSTNSLVGSQMNDEVGSNGVRVLTNGNYVVSSSKWNNGSIVQAGAVTWGNGLTGISGAVTPVNSLVGSQTNDIIGSYGVTALDNGNYIVISQSWNNGTIAQAGAVTWGNGTTGISGAITPTNSLVGSSLNDQVGNGHIYSLSNGNFIINSRNVDYSGLANAGAITWGNGLSGIVGTINSCNSVLGEVADENLASVYNTTHNYFIISKPKSSKIVITNKLIPYNAAVSITSDDADNNICDRALITFTASPTHGGNTPSYQWKIGPDNVGTNSPSFATTSLTNGQVVSVAMTSSDACAAASPATSTGITTSVTTIDKATSIVNGVITSAQNDAAYQWLDCDNANTPIAGATSQSFAPGRSGNFAVTISKASCTETTACANLVIAGIDDKNNSLIKIFPNPLTEKIQVELNENLITADILISDIDGKLVYEKLSISAKNFTIDATLWSAGKYLIRIISGDKVNNYKVVKM